MPIYVYELDTDDENPPRFEFFQKMSDPPFKRHPETGQPIRRVVAQLSVKRKGYAARSDKEVLSDNNMERLGFNKYVKGQDGYEKEYGQGPDLLGN
ncbi:MAG: FmdB family transcriptional regulator [Planctomycetes bacterium]|nr:FmdB family transcriptional regulator [Planctomycetota bacterium]